MKIIVKTPVLIGVLVVFLGGLGWFAFNYINNTGSLDHGQISYTPGVAPWDEKDPAKKAQFSKMPGELHTNSQELDSHGPKSFTPAGK